MIENDTELDNLLAERQNTTELAINFDKPNKDIKNEQLNIENASKQLIQQGVDAAVIHKVTNDDDVKQQFLHTADKVVNANLNAIENEADIAEKQSILKNNKDACDLYGIDEATVPKWVVRCAKLVQDFWYAIWLIIGFFTTVPVVFLGKKIKVVIKHTWVAMTLAIVIYLIAATSPLWLQLFKQ